MNYITIKKLVNTRILSVVAIVFALMLNGCSETSLPEAGSIPDLTPPQAAFGAVTSPENHLTINFANLSTSATDYEWDFGDGNTSTDKDASNTYPDVGEYTVTLVASDKLGVMSSSTQLVVVTEPEAITPIINEAGFEDGSTACGDGADGRDCWRIDGGEIHQISGDSYEGDQSAKYPTSSKRVSYQALTVSKDTDYVVSMYYSMKDDNPGGIMRLSILGKAISNADDAEENIIATVDGTVQEGSKTWNKLTLTFNSGDSTTIAIWLDSNMVAEARADDLTIKLLE